MKKTKEVVQIKQKIIEILKEEGVIKAGIFGSYARGDQTKDSDIDILIECPKDRKFSLFDLIGLEMRLKKALRKKIDLLTYNGINHLLKDIILSEEVRII